MFLSIIIPVYRTEKYLKECLDSCLEQDISYDDYEIICVDDGSPDRCGEILDTYSKNYKNIVVVHKSNAGVSAARNDGIEKSRGDYIWFVDSDDFIEKNILGEIKSFVQSHNCVNVKLGAYVMTAEELTVSEQEDRKNGVLKPGNAYLCMRIFDGKTIRENGIRFHIDGALAEDLIFIFEYKTYQNGDTCDYEPISYFYRQNSNSALHTDRKKYLPSIINVASIMRTYWCRGIGDVDYADFISSLYVYHAISIIVKLRLGERQKYLRELKDKNVFGFKPSESAIIKLKDKKIKVNPRYCASMHGYYYMLFRYKIRKILKKVYRTIIR